MTPEDFTAWVASMKDTSGWSERECTRQLGCGINQITRWKASGAPLYIGLACAALSIGIKDWTSNGRMNSNMVEGRGAARNPSKHDSGTGR